MLVIKNEAISAIALTRGHAAGAGIREEVPALSVAVVEPVPSARARGVRQERDAAWQVPRAPPLSC